jgi:ADP-heptose:LPS heptosyltransferase
MVRPLLENLGYVSRRKLARGLIARANVARDSGRFAAAAALYQEAIDLGWSDPRIRVQCGNMLKDSGQYREAEQHYLRAIEALPGDADVLLQMGHAQKMAGDLVQAESYYRRALELQPGWEFALKELAGLAGSEEREGTGSSGLPSDIVMELLPRAAALHPEPNLFRLFQLGRQVKGRRANLKQLRCVEAIRGYQIAPAPLETIRLLIDGTCAREEALVPYPIDGGAGGTKNVFNLWHDFSSEPPGPHMIELRLYDKAGKVAQRHREQLEIAPPLDEETAGSSDAWVPAPVDPHSQIDEAVNGLPSVIRSTERKLLPQQIDTILVQRADQLGDLACSVPALRRLRGLFPKAKLVGLLTPANAALAEALALFDEIVTVDFSEDPTEGRRVLGVDAQRALRRELSRYAFDLAIDLGEGGDSRPLLLLSGARFLYGFRNRQFGFLHAGMDFSAHDPINSNEVLPPSRKFVLLIEGLIALMHGVAEPIPHEGRSALAALGISPGIRYAVIHTGARLFFSRWPGFEALVHMLLDRTDLEVIVLGENESFGAGLGPAQRARLHVISGTLPFEQLDALIGHAALFIGNDSGPKHLAALRGVPTVSIHIPRNNWSEWGQEMSGTIITRRVPCAGCGIAPDGTDCGRNYPCIRRVTPDEVFAAATQALEQAI